MAVVDSGRRTKTGSIIWKAAPTQHQRVSSQRRQTYRGGVKITDNQRTKTVDRFGNVSWEMPDSIRRALNYRPTKAQERATALKSIKRTEAKTSILPTQTQANNAFIVAGYNDKSYTGVQTMENKSLKSSTNWWQRLDSTKFFRGFLPGGITRTDYVSQYSIPALDARTVVEEQYQEAKDRLESTKQMAKVKDRETDYAYKLSLQQQELTFKQAEESLKQELDASQYRWYEMFDKQEKALRDARANIGREQEARRIEQNAFDLREEQNYSSLANINRSLKNDVSSPPSSGFGTGFLSGAGTSTAVLLAIGAVVLLKK